MDNRKKVHNITRINHCYMYFEYSFCNRFCNKNFKTRNSKHKQLFSNQRLLLEQPMEYLYKSSYCLVSFIIVSVMQKKSSKKETCMCHKKKSTLIYYYHTGYGFLHECVQQDSIVVKIPSLNNRCLLKNVLITIAT